MTLAVITGAARGIGRSIAERLQASGHSLLLVDVSEAVDQTAAELGAQAVRADITDPAGRDAIAAAIDASDGPFTVLVNNAGITRDALLRKMEEDAFRLVVKVNLGATIALTEFLAPRLADGGSVINLSSRAQLGNVGQFNYIISKGGVIGATRAHALEFAPRIRVNAVAPGFIASEMTDAMPAEVRQRIIDKVPLERAGQPADIAGAVAWLSSPDAAYVTGEVIYVTGGRTFG